MNIFNDEDESFKKIKEDMSNCKRMISKLDVADAIGEIFLSTMSAMVLTHNTDYASFIAAIDAKRSLDKLFPEESQDEGKPNAKSVEARIKSETRPNKRKQEHMVTRTVSNAKGEEVVHYDMLYGFSRHDVLEKLYYYEQEEEGQDTENVPDTKQDTEKWSTDLKHRLFMRAADYRLPLQTAVENYKTEEQRRLAKYTALLSLISEAGLMGEYNEWLYENSYES